MSKQVYRVEVSEDGTIQWYDFETGKRHNKSGPAIMYPDGYKEYYIHGKLHNEDGPAVVYTNGYKAYYIHGELHNEDGPAIMQADEGRSYYIHGKKLTESEFLARNKTSYEEKTIVVDGQTYKLVKAD